MKVLYKFDMTRPDRSAVKADMPFGSCAMHCDRFLACGGLDGKLRLMDPNLRKTRVEHTFDAHSGCIMDIAAKNDYIVTCGMSARSINPYDKSAPTQLIPDSFIKVFDLRMMRQVAPMPFHGGQRAGPTLLKFLPHFSSQLIAVASTGQFEVVDVSNPSTMGSYGMVENEGLSCMAISGNGDYFGFGSMDGAIMQWGENEGVPINAQSNPTTMPTMRQPLRSIHPQDVHTASAYYLQPPSLSHRTAANATQPLLSAAQIWPDAQVLKPAAQQQIRQSFLAQMAKNPGDFLGYIPNQTAKLELNSLLRGKSRDKVYEQVDPRMNAARRKRTMPRIDPNQASIPHRYQHHLIDLSVRGFDGFDFGRYNQTIFAGLETSTAHSYVNVSLQCMYFVQEIRAALLMHLEPLLPTSDLGEELGFLFHMLDLVKVAPANVKSCQATNFLRAFRMVPEAAALGLLQHDIALNQRIESFFRFLLTHLDKALTREVVKGKGGDGKNSDGNSGQGNQGNSKRKGNKGGGGAKNSKAQVTTIPSIVNQLFGCTIRQTNEFQVRCK
jgi:PAB-dependent poly(A)-specific ribonuclease subunit 2